MLNTNIDYNLMADALQSYADLGYKQIEVPWYLPKQEMILAPEDNSFTLYSNKFLDMKCALIGSAEQSLVYMAKYNYLVEDQLYMSVTPCFREDESDNTHQSHFLKLELFLFSQKKLSPHLMLEDIMRFNKVRSNNITTDYSQDRIFLSMESRQTLSITIGIYLYLTGKSAS